MRTTLIRLTSVLFIGVLGLMPLPAHVHAGASVSIVSVYPLGGVTPGQNVTFSVVASGFTDPTYTLSDTFTGSSASASNLNSYGSFSWTPGLLDAGLHNFTVTATDSNGDSGTASMGILVIGSSVIIQNLAPSTSVTPGTAVSFSVIAPGFNSPVFYASDGYAGSSVSNASISTAGSFHWTPLSNEQGLHTLTITAIDSDGRRASATQSISVTAPAVQLVSVTPQSNLVGAGTTLSFVASTTGFTSPIFSLTDYFGGLTSTVGTTSLNTTTGAFSWTPKLSDIGSHTLTITTMDSAATTTTATVSKTVEITVPTVQVQPVVPTVTPSITGQTSASTSTSSGYVFSISLGIGSTGAAVTALQQKLTALQLYSGPVTGYYGPLTAAGVRAFQKAHGISPLGIVGPATRAALNAH